MAQLNRRKNAILATDDVEQVELTFPREALRQAGAEVAVVSPKSGQIHGKLVTSRNRTICPPSIKRN